MRLLDGTARLAGVVGWPVAQSRSPRLHGHWLERYGINGAYVPLAVRPEDLPAVLTGLRKAGFAGVNMTIPHKEAVVLLCDRLAASAARAGAVNTIVFEGGEVVGHNTDGAGFIANLQAQGVALQGAALILGAGGAARAIGAALQDAGMAVSFCNRTKARAAALAQALAPAGVVDWADKAGALGEFSLLVNTTSLGMTGQPALDISLAQASGLVVAEIVYTPLQTPLLAAAEVLGLKTVAGLGMLLHQAVPGFAAWFGVTPVVDEELYRVVAG